MEIKNKLVMQVEATCARLQRLPAVTGRTKVAWAILRNAAGVAGPMADLRQVLEPTAAMKAREAARQALLGAHAAKGEDGRPLMEPVPDRPDLKAYRIDDVPAYTAALEALLAEHPQAKDDEGALAQRELELMEETIAFEPYALHIGDVPDGALDAAAMAVLFEAGILVD